MPPVDFEKGITASAQRLNGRGMRFLIIHARWNYPVIAALVKGAKETMINKYNVRPEDIVVKDVPGSYELPSAAQILIRQAQTSGINDLLTVASPKEGKGQSTAGGDGPFDAVICIGVLIKGSTMHFEYIADTTSHGIMKVSLETGVPIVFGVLTCLNDEQAKERAGIAGVNGSEGHNHGEDWGAAAVEMASLRL
ncbi:lumazine synthase [Spiromyces aspiralis]|uniref:Lumazine synthase n=1 Tax=Spiromyces aspiralis TaxID=68401 RepID=A0ACC1HUS7_9FUNG|nr:lumazine synthase [Spiromyces aspiralis]